jgi:hypothetical protein
LFFALLHREFSMKKFVSAMLSATALLGTAGALTLIPVDNEAQARGSGSRGGFTAGARSHSFSRGARIGVFVGAPIIAAPWRYSYSYPYYGYGPYYPYYAPPAVYVQEQPAVYVEQQAPAAQPAPSAPSALNAPQAQPQQYWYYCQDSKTYYPHVPQCATPWQRVIPHAPQ